MNSWANDSVYVQFDGSVNEAGAAIYQSGTTSAMSWTLEDCINCGVSGWGWRENGFGAGVLGPLVYFANAGPQRLRVQVCQDGLALDQIVLSAGKYFTAPPDETRNDTTILP